MATPPPPAASKLIVPNDPAYRDVLDPAAREKKFEDEFEESSEVEPSPDELDAPPEAPPSAAT